MGRRRLGAGLVLRRFAGWPGSSLASATLSLVLVAALLGESYGETETSPTSHQECADLVPEEEVLRGKGSFYSGCETLSDTHLGGCWTQPNTKSTLGCQTCNIVESHFSEALFPTVFSLELDPCPSDFDFTSFYEEKFGALSVVSAASLTSPDCPEGWLYSEHTNNCYFKSPNTEKAANQADAASKCEEEGAWVIAINSEEENDFLTLNMLWIGFFGETYTGMVKDNPSAEWTWPDETSATTYDCLEDYSNWIEGADAGCAASFDDGEDSSCMEIYPYEPKLWNPFSCIVGKHFVCEKPSTWGQMDSTGTTTTSLPTPAPIPSPTPAPSPSPTPSPTTSAPEGAPSLSPTEKTPAPSTGAPEQATPMPTTSTTPTPVGSMAGSSPVGSQSTPTSSVSASGTLAPTGNSTMSGDNVLSITKRGAWLGSEYSLFLMQGDEETPVATNVTKSEVGTVTDTYNVEDGCYRLSVISTGDPTVLWWDIAGGDAHGSSGTSGQGLDGSMFTVGGGVCDADECQAQCLSAMFSGLDSGSDGWSRGTCDGFGALISGLCNAECPDSNADDLQESCVNCGCDVEMVCGLDMEGGVSVGVEYGVEIKVLLEAPVASTTSGSTGAGNANEEFEEAVAFWLGVESEVVSVTAVDGTDVEEGQEEDGTSSRRRLGAGPVSVVGPHGTAVGSRGLQTDSTSTSETAFTRYSARVQPSNFSDVEASNMRSVAAEDVSTEELEGWLRGSGTTWSSVTVVSVEGVVVEELSTDTSEVDSDTMEESGSEGTLGNVLVVGGISAGAVLVVAMMICVCCRSSRRRDKKTMAIGRSLGSATRDFEAGGGGQIYQAQTSDGWTQQHNPHYHQQQQQPPKHSGRDYREDLVSRFNKDDRFSVVNTAAAPRLRNVGGVGGASFSSVGGSSQRLTGKTAGEGLPSAGGGHQQQGYQLQRQEGESPRVAARRDDSAMVDQSSESGSCYSPSSSELDSDSESDDDDDSRDSRDSSGDGDGLDETDMRTSTSTVSRSAESVSRTSQNSHQRTSSDVSAPSASAQHQDRRAKNRSGGLKFVGIQQERTESHKRPSFKGPSGALASLGFARGQSQMSEDDNDRDFNDMGGERSSSSSGFDPDRQRERISPGSMAKVRIQEMHNRQRGQSSKTLMLDEGNTANTTHMPVPMTPGTDRELAEGLAPTPSRGMEIRGVRSGGSSGRRRMMMVDPTNPGLPRTSRARRRPDDSRREEDDGSSWSAKPPAKPPVPHGGVASLGGGGGGSTRSSQDT